MYIHKKKRVSYTFPTSFRHMVCIIEATAACGKYLLPNNRFSEHENS